MKRVISLFLFFILVLLNPRNSFAETLTLTTYYPSPFGAYDQVLLVPRGSLNGNCQAGTLAVLTGTPPQLMFCGTGNWATATNISGAWTQNGTNLYPSTLSWNIGIGTAGPGAKLSVSGGMGVGSPYATTAVADGKLIVSGNIGVATSAVAGDARITMGNTALDEASKIAFYEETNGASLLGIGAASYDTSNKGVGIWARQTGTFASNVNMDIFIKQGGNVGIGTGTPGYKLDVNGSMNVNGIGSFTNVGVGTTGPTKSLDINGTVRIRADCSASNPCAGKFLGADDDLGNASWKTVTYSP